VRPKILFVINSLAGGGAERVIVTLLSSSRHYLEEYDVSLALLDRESEAYPPPDWLPVHRLDAEHSLLRSCRQFWALAKREQPDLTVSFLTRANITTAAVMKARGRPSIISERVDTTAHFGAGLRASISRSIVRASYRQAVQVIAISQGVANTLVAEYGLNSERVRVIYNPVDVDLIRRLSTEQSVARIDKFSVVAMGRLVTNKNFGMAIRAFAASGLPGRMLLLGEGPRRPELQAVAAECGLGDRLVMPGFVSNPYALIAHADVFVLSSNAEGFSNALVEAMALGLPVVATDCPSGPAEVLDVRLEPGCLSAIGRGGVLVPVSNVTAMAQALRKMSEGAIRAEMSQLALERARDFSLDRAVRCYWDLISSVLRTGAGA
jgi:N-acetylgalactosamine-N,N'-diacetylbacillosaminyl-diphospho-undecaprenol 4-alpha-N-acetylgalactosaminyltransferase